MRPPTPLIDSLLKEIESLRTAADGATVPVTPPVTPPLTQDVTVAAGGDIQKALDTVPMGATIWLAQGATYKVNLKLPNRVGAGTITLRTSGLTDDLLKPGVRVSPTDPLTAKMAKLAPLDPVYPTVANLPGAHDFTLIGLEFTGNTVMPDRDLLMFGIDPTTGKWTTTYDGQPLNLVIDRCYIHGEPATGGHRGILADMRNGKILNCYLSSFWENGRDSQAIGVFQGQGPLLIENCYLEASGENFLAGGSDPVIPNAIPSDITFRGNLCVKPLAWKGASPQRGTCKNLFELKNARRVLIEYNTFENVWVDGQSGSAILFTVRNQDGNAPWCNVTDVVFQHNVIKNAAGFAFNILATDNNHPSGMIHNLIIRNNLCLNVAAGMQVIQAIVGLEVAHNTFTGIKNSFLNLDSQTGMIGLNYHDNVTIGGIYGLAGTNTGLGTPSLEAFAAGYTFKGNVIDGNIERTIGYPPGNFPLPAGTLLGRLSPTSLYTGPEIGTDGKKPGVDPTLLRTS